MMKPEPRKAVNGWRRWPQSLAPSEVMDMTPSGGKAHGYQEKLLICAERLAFRGKRVKGHHQDITAVVVFYPRRLQTKVARNLQRYRVSHKGNMGPYKGLTISATPKLRSCCVAFFISDVEAHRTPADAYYTEIQGGSRDINPEPLYKKSVRGTGGKPIHE